MGSFSQSNNIYDKEYFDIARSGQPVGQSPPLNDVHLAKRMFLDYIGGTRLLQLLITKEAK